MPSIDDYDKSDEDSGGLSDGYTPAQSAAVGSATGAPKQATPTKQQDDGYVPWSSFVSANQDVSQREAGKLSGQVQGDVTKAQGDLSGAQGAFRGDIASNYNPPAAKSSAAPSGTPTPKTTPQSEQNQAPATSATSSTTGTGKPPAASARGTAPATTATAAPGTALDGANTHLQSSSQPVAQNRATPVGATDNRVTSQNPSAFTPASQSSPNQAPNQSSPWSSFLPAAQAGPSAAQPPSLNLANERERSQQLGANAAANGAQGPKDLESAAGQSAWAQLLGDTKKAQDEANALGSESGVQGLLQQNASGPTNTAFDAALINGQGGPQFRQLAQKYGGDQLEQGVVGAEKASQDAWDQLRGDVATRQAFDAAAKGQSAPASSSAQDPTATTASQQSNNATLGITQTSGANGQFDPSGFPASFDPSSSPQYQQAQSALQQAAPIPSYADTPHDFLNAPGTENISNAWAKQLGVSYDALRTMISQMPQWQWQLFARGIVPSGIDRSGGQGYFEGFNPVNVQATGAGTDPKYKAFADAMQVYEAALTALAGPSGAAFSSTQTAVTQANTKQPQSTDPFGTRG